MMREYVYRRTKRTSSCLISSVWILSLLACQLSTKLHAASVGERVKLPLKTKGQHIVDAGSKRFKLQCVSWSGAQEKWFVPSGLWQQPASTITTLAKQAGFNCIRIVWSTEMVLRSANGTATVPQQAVSANPGLVGKSPLQVMDAVIASIAQQVCLSSSSVPSWLFTTSLCAA
jgi:aryl-phospho-beta-D-glucosidase BglC (GH1 family)